MAARRAAERDDLRRQKRIAAADRAHGLAGQRELEVGEFPVRPVEHALVAVDAQPDVVLAAGGRLRDGERAARTAFEFDQRGDVVDDLAARQQRAQVGGNARAEQPGDEAREMLRVAADRAHHERLPAAVRIEEPAQAVVLRAVLERASRARSGCIRPGRAGSRRARRRARASARSRVIGYAEYACAIAKIRPRAARARRRGRGPAAKVVRDRLVADDVEAGVERRGGERVVGVVRRHDRDRVDAVRAPAARVRASRRRRRSCAPDRIPARRPRRASARDRSRTRRPSRATSRPSRQRRDACVRSMRRVRRRRCRGAADARIAPASAVIPPPCSNAFGRATAAKPLESPAHRRLNRKGQAR